MKPWLPLLVALVAGVSPLASAAASRAEPPHAAEWLACGARGAEARVTLGAESEIVCRPHARVAGRLERYVVTCAPLSGPNWDCGQPRRALDWQTGHRRLLLERDSQTTPADAVEIARFVEGYGYTFNGRDLSAMVNGVCRVSDDGAPFAGARSFRLSCGRESVTVTRDCFQGRCRLFPATLEPVPGVRTVSNAVR